VLGAWEAPFQHDIAGFVHPPPPDLFGVFNAVHLALIPVGPHRGKVFTMDQGFPQEYPMQQQRMALLDFSHPGQPAFTNFELPMPVPDPAQGFELFCSGHVWLPDGRLFLAGGTLSVDGPGDHEEGLGVSLAYIWNPAAPSVPGSGLIGTWTRLPDLQEARYYPSATLLGNGRVIVAGGTGGPDGHTLNSYEVWDTAAGAWQPGVFGGPPVDLHGYPRLSLLTSGALFLSGMDTCSYLLNHDLAPGFWAPADCSEGPTFTLYNTSLLAPGFEDVVLKLGGLQILADNQVVMNAAWRSNAGAGAPGWDWQLTASQPRIARSYANAVIMANGDVALVGGYSGTGEVDDQGILIGADVGLPLVPEIRDMDTGEWRMGAPAQSSREYHSAALLLPDGRVLVSGGEIRLYDYEIYRPWYLTCGLPRPVITSAPSSIKVQKAGGAHYEVKHELLPPGVSIERVALLAPGSVTHHSDFQQRFVDLQIINKSTTSVRFLGPETINHAPRGWYMLVLITSDGIPSVARWTHVD
jgi:hypothetical protein